MADSKLENRVRRLEALRAVDDLICDLGRAFDGGPSVEALRRLFTADAAFIVDRYGTFEGGEAIALGIAGNAGSGFRWTLHYLVSPRVLLTAGDTAADIDFYLWEVATAASGRAYWIGGRYEAQAIVTDDGWRFARLELKADLISHYPDGWHPKPNALDAA